MKLINIACGLLILSVFFSCVKKEGKETTYIQPLYQNSVSKGFEINSGENTDNTLIRVKNPWQGAENIKKDFLIVRDGEIPENYEGQFIRGKADRIICMSSTHIAMLEALGATDKIVGVSGLPYISNPYIRQHENFIPDVGYEGNMNYELLLAAKPDLVLLFSVNGNSSLEQRLEEFGIPYLYIGDYVEEDPLGKLEWIVPIAEVIGKREEGERIFNDISTRYLSMKRKVENYESVKPKVMLNAPFGDSWFMPSTSSYVARMIKDAGADYVYTKDTGSTSLPIDIEEAYILLDQSDFWLNTGTFKTIPDLKSSLPRFQNSKPVTNGKVYNNNLITSSGGGNDCYESGVVNPDLILKDLIKIFHPELVEEEFTYYHQLQ